MKLNTGVDELSSKVWEGFGHCFNCLIVDYLAKKIKEEEEEVKP